LRNAAYFPEGKHQGRSVFRLFNPEPTATVANPEKNTVAVGSGLNDPMPIWKTDRPSSKHAVKREFTMRLVQYKCLYLFPSVRGLEQVQRENRRDWEDRAIWQSMAKNAGRRSSRQWQYGDYGKERQNLLRYPSISREAIPMSDAQK
jgi:hypothetical protein